MSANPKRVVITGMGVITPLGLDVPTTWSNLINGVSGIGPLTAFDTTGFEARLAGEARGFDPQNYMSLKEARRMDRFAQFAVAALAEAMQQSRLEINETNAYRIGSNVGSSVGGIATYHNEFHVLEEKGPRRINPFLATMIVIDAAAVQVALRTGARGPNFGIASACATGADAIGMAYDAIRHGRALAMITGGVDATLTPISLAAYDRIGALSHRNDDPQAASRPFDGDRDGFVPSEGGAVLVLEELEHALRRGAEPLAEIISYASTSDAIHLTAPDKEGEGAATCMQLACEAIGLPPQEIDYINAHGTSTRLGDVAETVAIKQVFGEYAYRLPISSTKSMTGHLVGGSGSLEAVICTQALRTGTLPPTINQTMPDPQCDLDYIPNHARVTHPEIVMTNSFGFGGHNATLLLKKWTVN
jgi:beta-ketoacyl-acyl-carrier-protein synthase II